MTASSQPSPAPGTLAGIPLLSAQREATTKGSILVLGPPKSGKTEFLCSWSKRSVMLYWDPDSSVAERAHADGRIGHLLMPDSARGLRGPLAPIIRNRQLSELLDGPVDTILFDTVSFFARLLKEEMKPTRIQDWGEYARELQDTLRIFINATKPDPKHPDRESYWFVAACHEQPLMTDDGRIARYTPMVSGETAAILPSMFGSVFIAEQKSTEQASGGSTSRTSTFILHTKPPDRQHPSVADGVGGNKTPAEVANSRVALVKHWPERMRPTDDA